MAKRRTIQAPILRYMLQAQKPVKRGELVIAIGGSSSSISGALTRLAGNGVVQRQDDGSWIIIDAKEADWLTQHTYHTKTRKEASQVAAKPQAKAAKPQAKAVEAANAAATRPRVVGVMESGDPIGTYAPNGELKMGDLFELIGRLPDGSKLVRTLDEGTVYKLEEV